MRRRLLFDIVGGACERDHRADEGAMTSLTTFEGALTTMTNMWTGFVEHARADRARRKREAEDVLAGQPLPKRARLDPDAPLTTVLKPLMTELKSFRETTIMDEIRGIHAIKYSDIKMEHQLGEGSFGVVRKARLWNQDVAVKSVRDPDRTFQEEIDILSEIRHPNVVEFMGTFRDQRDRLHLVSEFCTNGSLENVLEKRKSVPLKLCLVLELAIQIAKGLGWLHHKNIMHRDLKPDNILLTGEMIAKISDFGLARRKSSGPTTLAVYSGVGTPEFQAPEVFGKQRYGFPADVFSYGMVLANLVSGQYKLPEVDDNDVDDVERPTYTERVRRGDRPFIVASCPDEIRKLIQRCWNASQEQRPTMDEVIVALESYRSTRRKNDKLRNQDALDFGTEMAFVYNNYQFVAGGGGKDVAQYLASGQDESAESGSSSGEGKEAKSENKEPKAAAAITAMAGAALHEKFVASPVAGSTDARVGGSGEKLPVYIAQSASQ